MIDSEMRVCKVASLEEVRKEFDPSILSRWFCQSCQDLDEAMKAATNDAASHGGGPIGLLVEFVRPFDDEFHTDATLQRWIDKLIRLVSTTLHNPIAAGASVCNKQLRIVILYCPLHKRRGTNNYFLSPNQALAKFQNGELSCALFLKKAYTYLVTNDELESLVAFEKNKKFSLLAQIDKLVEENLRLVNFNKILQSSLDTIHVNNFNTLLRNVRALPKRS